MDIKAEVSVMHLQAKECQILPASYQKLGGAWNGCSLTVLRRNPPCQHLDVALLASRNMRQEISVVKTTQFAVFCYGSPRKLAQREINILSLSHDHMGRDGIEKAKKILFQSTHSTSYISLRWGIS